ncbi:NAD(P)/FAD-dependent oxidoreductase [Paracoccus sp. Z330]|uniref:NAD(P)/FAD-dependent oxidoreductase n=1 Tax=Paracoccus onchidii TaxID=3017813 RepID=A0ABT4ZEB7_9RHOB|nr:NAD(P)/FAD-dependent oxidoreductase [Paracoccus onchidii]MDB6177704.1 NAD(P)/FAD-dependent oxidoreductase [Paracoccus onchidii]
MKTEHDILIVGAGPAGMAAAVQLADLGFAPLVIDEQAMPGGQIWRASEGPRSDAVRRALGPEYAEGADRVARFRLSGVDYMPGTRLWHIEPGFQVFMSRDETAFSRRYRAVLLATGAQERPVPVPGWTLPGVMTVGAAQILLKTSAQIPEAPVWIAGSGPLPLLYMRQLLALGGQVAGFLDTTPKGQASRVLPHAMAALRGRGDLIKGVKWLRQLRATGLPWLRGVRDVQALGQDRIEAVRYTAADGRVHEQSAQVLLLHEGVVPSIHTTLAMNCEHDWSEAQGCFIPRTDERGMTSVDGLFLAGDGAGIGGALAAEERGRIAALGIAGRLGQDAPAAHLHAAHAGLARRLASRPVIDALYPPSEAQIPDETVICRCEELTAGDIRVAARLHRGGPNQVKAYTRCGMGPCQGRQCGYSVNRILSEEYGQSRAETGFFRIRPPLKPVTLGELAALEEGREAP